MEIDKQYIVLGLIRSGRYKANPLTGEIISLIGKSPRVLQGIRHESGYIQQGFDLGYNKGVIMVYAHVFVYLYGYGTYNPGLVIGHKNDVKNDNRLANLRAITQAQNLIGNGKSEAYVNRNPLGDRRRLTADEKESIKALHSQHLSMINIAKQIGTTRQTVGRVLGATY